MLNGGNSWFFYYSCEKDDLRIKQNMIFKFIHIGFLYIGNRLNYRCYNLICNMAVQYIKQKMARPKGNLKMVYLNHSRLAST